MGTARELLKKHCTNRPKKNARERRRRDKVQMKRLIAAGVPEAEVRKMTSQAVRKRLAEVSRRKA